MTGRPDRDWWAPVVDDRLVVLIEDVQGVGSHEIDQEHRVVVCEDRETAHRFALWHCHQQGLPTSTPISEVYWPRYLDGLQYIGFDDLTGLMLD